MQPGLPFNPWTRPVLEAYQFMCGKAADGIREAGGFGEPEQWRFDWDRPYTRDEWLDQVPTMGGHPAAGAGQAHCWPGWAPRSTRSAAVSR